jgi:hypothetical protein
MTDGQAQEVAGAVARAIRGRSAGDPARLATWTDAAYRWGASVQKFVPSPGAGGGYYDAGTATIYYAHDPHDEATNCRRVVHELAHHVLTVWPGSQFPRAALESYDDTRQSVQHRIARAVEALVVR